MVIQTQIIIGSSPLTRGAQTITDAGGMGLGLIPAHAGSTLISATAGDSATAHPRSRGEHPGATTGVTRVVGSSPLTRGAPSLNSGGGAVHIGRGTT